MITTNSKVIVTKGSRSLLVDKGVSAQIQAIQPLGAEYGHKVRVTFKFLNGFKSGKVVTYYARHSNRLADTIIRFNNGDDPTNYFEVKIKT
jgi:hypothetical protein